MIPTMHYIALHCNLQYRWVGGMLSTTWVTQLSPALLLAFRAIFGHLLTIDMLSDSPAGNHLWKLFNNTRKIRIVKSHIFSTISQDSPTSRRLIKLNLSQRRKKTKATFSLKKIIYFGPKCFHLDSQKFVLFFVSSVSKSLCFQIRPSQMEVAPQCTQSYLQGIGS